MSPSARLRVPAALAVLMALCAGRSAEGMQGARSALDAVTSGIWKLPLTTSSEAARGHFLAGVRELDLGQGIEAQAHFAQAVAADPSFALGYLYAAFTANSFEEYKRRLDQAEGHAARATEAERLLIQATRRGLDNDVEGQVALLRQLVAKHGDSPRAWLSLAGVQQGMNRSDEARASMRKALEFAPRLFVAHTDLGNSYLFNEPRDFTKALEHMQHAAALAPDEPWPHDLLGDVYRAQGDLSRAGAEYTRAHELKPTDAPPLQQRGHVNSFLGNYAGARADYDSAIALGRANEKGFYAVYRALVGVHAGEPGAAIAELNQLVASIPQMGTPDPRGTQIFALTTAAVIAIHTRDFAAAEQALRQRATMLRQQADEIGTPAVRRSQEADIAYFEGWLAARRGDYARARTLADSVARLVEPDANPRKIEGVHELRGFIALYQGNAAEAVGHFEHGNPNNTYITYQLALAHEGAGHADQAKRLFRDVAGNNFNDAGFALVRKEALQKVSGARH